MKNQAISVNNVTLKQEHKLVYRIILIQSMKDVVFHAIRRGAVTPRGSSASKSFLQYYITIDVNDENEIELYNFHFYKLQKIPK